MISFCIPYRPVDQYRKEAFDVVHRSLVYDWPDDEILISDSGDDPFSRSKSRNDAARSSTGDTLVFVDADSFVSKEQIQVAVTTATTFGWCFPYDRYYSLTPTGSDYFRSFGEVATIHDVLFTFPGPDPVDRPPSVGGCVVVRRGAFEAVGGYDERFLGWSFEDRAFAYALEALYGRARRVSGALYHLWHPTPEELCFGQPHMEDNRALCRRYEEARTNPHQMSALVREHP